MNEFLRKIPFRKMLHVIMGKNGGTSKLFFIFAPILIFFKQNVHLYGLLKMAILFQKGV
jgi:hypothetical protein